MDVVKLTPRFGTINLLKTNAHSKSLRQLTRTITKKQMAQQERFNRAAYYAWRQIRNEGSRLYFEQVASAKDLPNAYVAAVTDYLNGNIV